MINIDFDFFNAQGYPTDEYLHFLKYFKPESIEEFEEFLIKILKPTWHYGDWGFKLKRPYRGIRRLELHTGGWSGNEMLIDAIKKNIYFTHVYMRYVMWKRGGHFYFEIGGYRPSDPRKYVEDRSENSIRYE